ncbi:MAG: branched-chain amino acid ABC transporter permease [Haloarculaceae archaeon]
MVEIGSILVTGLMVSSVYALIAIGFTLIYGLRGVLNLSHGALLMIGAYTYLVSNRFLPKIGAFVAAIVVAGIASYVLYQGLVRFIEDDVVITFLSTLLIAIILQQLFVVQFSTAPRSLAPMVSGGIQIAGTRVRLYQIVAFALSWVALALLWLFVRYTETGQSVLATSMTEKGARLSGINVDYVNGVAWLLAGAFAGFAGVFIGSLQSTSPTMWVTALGLAFVIVTVGGVGSIKGSIVGAYLIGFLQTITVTLGGANLRGMFSFALLIAIILIRPQGLFGREFLE